MFQFLEHPSETLIEVRVRSAREVFTDAATALFEIMTDTAALKETQQFDVSLPPAERHLLLIDWLNYLIYLHEVNNVFLRSFEVTIDDSGSLCALVKGETISDHHERRMHAKSVTYGQLEWIEENNQHIVRFVVDI